MKIGKPTYDMKKLILLLFIPLLSFGQNFPFEISNDIVKLNEYEKEEYLFNLYSTYEKDSEWDRAYEIMRTNSQVYKQKGVDLNLTNIVIKSFGESIVSFDKLAENILSKETVNAFYSSINKRVETIQTLVNFDYGVKNYDNYYKYIYYILEMEGNILKNDGSVYSKRKWTELIGFFVVNNIGYQVSINSTNNLHIKDVIIGINK